MKLYVLVDSDLSPGMQMAQAVHAAFSFAVEHPSATELWHRDSNYLVILGSDDLERDVGRIETHPLSVTVRVHEPDLPGNPLTAVVVAPSDHVSRLVSHLPLALRERAVT